MTSDAAASWKVEDGAIVCTGQPGTWLRSQEQYCDFNLRFEYRLSPGGNSGIYLRVPADGHIEKGAGPRLQLLDDNADRYKNIEPDQYCGSLYKVVPAKQHVSRPAGQWNTMEINCQGTDYRIVHNGVVILDASAVHATLSWLNASRKGTSDCKITTRKSGSAICESGPRNRPKRIP